MMLEGLKKAGENRAAGMANGTAQAGAEKNTAGAVEEQFSIVNLDNGMSYVKADRQVIYGNTLKEQKSAIIRFINGIIRGGKDLTITATNGDPLTITHDTAGKISDNYERVDEVHEVNGKKIVEHKQKPLSEEMFLVKIHAGAHIDELSEISKPFPNQKPREDKMDHSFARKGFTYRKVFFEDYDGSYYMITLSIGIDEISTVYNIGRIKEAKFPRGKIISAIGSKAPGELASKGKITTSGGGSQGQKSTKDADYPAAVERGDKKTAQQMVDAAQNRPFFHLKRRKKIFSKKIEHLY